MSPPTHAAEPMQTVVITMDLPRFVKLDSAISTVVIGNSDIADATVQDKHTLLLTGRGPGITNLIVFEDSGKQISNLLVRVMPQKNRVIVRSDSTQYSTFLCLPACSPLHPAAAVQPSKGGGEPSGPASPGSGIAFANCDAARKAGVVPVPGDHPKFGPHLDEDDDGIGCEE